jgi:hypothetical protein
MLDWIIEGWASMLMLSLLMFSMVWWSYGYFKLKDQLSIRDGIVEMYRRWAILYLSVIAYLLFRVMFLGIVSDLLFTTVMVVIWAQHFGVHGFEGFRALKIGPDAITREIGGKQRAWAERFVDRWL